MADEKQAILEGRDSASKRKSFFKRKKSKDSSDDPNAPRTSKDEAEGGDEKYSTVESFSVSGPVAKPEGEGRPTQTNQSGNAGEPDSPRQSLKSTGGAGILNYQRKSGPPPTAEYLDRTSELIR